MLRINFHGDLSLQKFFMDWFGLIGGRELCTNVKHEFGGFPSTPSHRKFTSNYKKLLDFVNWCEGEVRPIWTSVQPFRTYGVPMALEKLYYDFDDDCKYCPKCDQYYRKGELVTIKKKKGSFCYDCGILCEVKPRLELIGREVKWFIRGLRQYEPLMVQTYKGYHVYLFLRRVFQFSKKYFGFAREGHG